MPLCFYILKYDIIVIMQERDEQSTVKTALSLLKKKFIYLLLCQCKDVSKLTKLFDDSLNAQGCSTNYGPLDLLLEFVPLAFPASASFMDVNCIKGTQKFFKKFRLDIPYSSNQLSKENLSTVHSPTQLPKNNRISLALIYNRFNKGVSP